MTFTSCISTSTKHRYIHCLLSINNACHIPVSYTTTRVSYHHLTQDNLISVVTLYEQGVGKTHVTLPFRAA